MSRIPPNLLYLTIYNPTLRPLGPVADDDEDAEEQAHILFYTSKERAVSRDRMLRQVGLAKALVNFSDMFNGLDTCNNVHSQSKRLIMVSPEPDFWIHAGVEVAKMPRTPPDKGKIKAKDKPKANEKGKEKQLDNAPLYDYQEGSVHDLALRADILRGYEQFKLTHGSFTSILSSIGQEGLELQLERFFTVWAWSWNLEDGAQFGDHLGIPLHPSIRSLGPTLDTYSQQLPDHALTIFIQPPYVAPSPQYSAANLPTSLIRHLLSLIPPTPLMSEDISHDGTIRNRRASDGDAPNGKDPPKGLSTSSFLGMPAVNMNVKWGWPAALTFGKGSSKRPSLEESKLGPGKDKEAGPAPETTAEAVALDHGALEDAMSDDVSREHDSSSTAIDGPSISPPKDMDAEHTIDAPSDSTDKVEDDSHASRTLHDGQSCAEVESASAMFSATVAEPMIPPQLPPTFSHINVHLPSPDDPKITKRQKVYYIINEQNMLALVGLGEESGDSDPGLSQSALILLDDIEALLLAELSKTLTPDQLTLSKILQPTDTHIVSTGQYTISSPNFSTKSGYLYDAEELQKGDPDISEVFSRGLSPQHWHIARRGLGSSAADDHGIRPEEVYLQIFRKEASLSDVDNVLAGVVRRSGLADGAV
ncbi:hypothetical protein DXG01_003315 [Tephrocybe rancida]|nr:hypothetical protein DXG01_003315 [Tephrocybe rancida]